MWCACGVVALFNSFLKSILQLPTLSEIALEPPPPSSYLAPFSHVPFLQYASLLLLPSLTKQKSHSVFFLERYVAKSGYILPDA